MDTAQELFTIGEISKYCKIPISTLRYYDEVGVIKPELINEETNYRYYGHETLMLVPILKYYKQYGFQLSEIRELLQRGDLAHLSRLFSKRIDHFRKEIVQLKAMSESLRSWQDLIFEAKNVLDSRSNYIQARYYPSIPVVSCHPALFKKKTLKHLLVCNDFAAMLPDIITCGPLFIEYPSKEKRLNENYESCTLYIEIHRDCNTEPKEFGKFYAVSGYHSGPHENIEKTYRAMETWAKEHSFALAASAVERYVIDDWSTKNSKNFVTEIILPLR